MQIIIHVVPRNILSVVIADGRAFLTCQVAFMLPQCNVEVITAAFKYLTPHMRLSHGGKFSCLSVQYVVDLVGILGICA